jgi:hypothetical protein
MGQYRMPQHCFAATEWANCLVTTASTGGKPMVDPIGENHPLAPVGGTQSCPRRFLIARGF